MSPVAPIEAPFHPRVIIEEEASDDEYVTPRVNAAPREADDMTPFCQQQDVLSVSFTWVRPQYLLTSSLFAPPRTPSGAR